MLVQKPSKTCTEDPSAGEATCEVENTGNVPGVPNDLGPTLRDSYATLGERTPSKPVGLLHQVRQAAKGLELLAKGVNRAVEHETLYGVDRPVVRLG